MVVPEEAFAHENILEAAPVSRELSVAAHRLEPLRTANFKTLALSLDANKLYVPTGRVTAPGKATERLWKFEPLLVPVALCPFVRTAPVVAL